MYHCLLLPLHGSNVNIITNSQGPFQSYCQNQLNQLSPLICQTCYSVCLTKIQKFPNLVEVNQKNDYIIANVMLLFLCSSDTTKAEGDF